mgnify:CR=1 FL=1
MTESEKDKCRNCGKEIYLRRNTLHSLGFKKEVRPYHIYHTHNQNMSCDDGSYNSVEREGKCIHCGFLVIEDNNSIVHYLSLLDRIFRRCKCNKPELNQIGVKPVPDLSKEWRGFKRSLGYN